MFLISLSLNESAYLVFRILCVVYLMPQYKLFFSFLRYCFTNGRFHHYLKLLLSKVNPFFNDWLQLKDTHGSNVMLSVITRCTKTQMLMFSSYI